jgi:hypothetical protein
MKADESNARVRRRKVSGIVVIRISFMTGSMAEATLNVKHAASSVQQF